MVMIATKTSFRVIFIGLSGPPFRSADYTRNEHGARHLDEAFAQAGTWTLLLFSLKAPVRIDPPAEERGFKPPVPLAPESASPSEGAMPREPIGVSKGSCNRRDQKFESLQR